MVIGNLHPVCIQHKTCVTFASSFSITDLVVQGFGDVPSFKIVLVGKGSVFPKGFKKYIVMCVWGPSQPMINLDQVIGLWALLSGDLIPGLLCGCRCLCTVLDWVGGGSGEGGGLLLVHCMDRSVGIDWELEDDCGWPSYAQWKVIDAWYKTSTAYNFSCITWQRNSNHFILSLW